MDDGSPVLQRVDMVEDLALLRRAVEWGYAARGFFHADSWSLWMRNPKEIADAPHTRCSFVAALRRRRDNFESVVVSAPPECRDAGVWPVELEVAEL